MTIAEIRLSFMTFSLKSNELEAEATLVGLLLLNEMFVTRVFGRRSWRNSY